MWWGKWKSIDGKKGRKEITSKDSVLCILQSVVCEAQGRRRGSKGTLGSVGTEKLRHGNFNGLCSGKHLWRGTENMAGSNWFKNPPIGRA